MRRFCDSLRKNGYDQVELYFAIKDKELIDKMREEAKKSSRPSHLKLVHSSSSIETKSGDSDHSQSQAA